MNLRFLPIPKEHEPLAPPFVLSLSGSHEVAVAPCRRIACYESDCVKLETVGCTVEVRGENLTLSSYYENEKEVRIKGVITSLGIERGQ